MAKDFHILPTKNNSVFVILFEILTNRLLTMLLILNNWPVVHATTGALRNKVPDYRSYDKKKKQQHKIVYKHKECFRSSKVPL